MATKLKKEKNEVFVISGKKHSTEKKPADVFQVYHFSFTSSSAEFIMTNVQPDAVVFMGALDVGFEWKNENQEAVNFMSGLLNILLAAKNAGVKKFYYLSSYSVFDGNTEAIISETTVPRPASLRSMTYLQAEETCLLHREEGKFQVVILRSAEVYGNYKKLLLENNIVHQLLFETDAPSSQLRSYHLIFLDDLLEGIYRVLREEKIPKPVIHIGPDRPVSIKEIQKAVDIFVIDEKVDILEQPSSGLEMEYDKTISATEIKKLGYLTKYSLEVGINRMETSIRSKRKAQVKNSIDNENEIPIRKRKGKLLPYIENVILFLLLELLLFATSQAALHESIDLYLWYVVLIVIVHGSAQGKLAILLSIVGKYLPKIFGGQDSSILFDYKSYLWMLQIICIGMLVSYGLDKFKRLVEDLTDDNKYLQKEFDNIKAINKSNVEAKNIFERRLVNYKNSLGKIYEIITKMDSLEPQKIVFEAIGVISQIMNTNDIAIYTCNTQTGFCRLLASSSEKAGRMGKSIRLNETGELGDCLKDKRLYRNIGFQQDYPLIAGATYENGNIETIIMVWSLELEDINLHQMNIFSIICRLMEQSMAKAYTYMVSMHSSSFIENSRVMQQTAFLNILELYTYGKAKCMLEFALLQVKDDHEIDKKELYQILGKLVRDTDYIGEFSDNKLYILLTNSGEEDAALVKDRILKNGIQVTVQNQYLISSKE